MGIDIVCLFKQVVGRIALCRYNCNDIVSVFISVRDNVRDIKDTLFILDGSTAEFLYN